MSWYKAMDISADDEGVNIYVRCYLNSKMALYKLIEELLKAKLECKRMEEEEE